MFTFLLALPLNVKTDHVLVFIISYIKLTNKQKQSNKSYNFETTLGAEEMAW